MADPRTVAPATSILVTLGLICFAEPGFAQQPDSSASAEALKKLSIEQLMNLEVTSVSRRPERLAQAASAIHVITQQDIRRSGASSLPEALRLVTNLQVAQVNSRDWAISARGLTAPPPTSSWCSSMGAPYTPRCTPACFGTCRTCPSGTSTASRSSAAPARRCGGPTP